MPDIFAFAAYMPIHIPSRWLVALQMICIATLAFTTHGSGKIMSVALLWTGAILGFAAIAQMLNRSRLSIFPEPKTDAQLVTHGVYALIRHPMYTAVLLATLGMVLSASIWWRWLLWGLLLVVLMTKMKLEEKMLQQKFTPYESYKARTKKLLPFIW